jgi:hypothetical protein
MFWWIAGAAVGVAKLILDSFSDQERQARDNWERTHRKVKKSTEEHRQHIEKHLRSARESWDFHVLADMHYSSMIVANVAWKTMKNASSSIRTVKKGLQQTRREIIRIQEQINNESNRRKKWQSIEEIKVVRQLSKEFQVEMKTLKSQSSSLLEEVKRLNKQTGDLKLAIRDRCGRGGLMWYEALEHRKSHYPRASA